MTHREAALPLPLVTNSDAAIAPADVELREARAQRSDLLYLQTNAGVQVAITPGYDVALHRIAIPTKSESQARRAAPYVIEDDLAIDVQHVHVAVAPHMNEGKCLAGAISHSKMADWQQELASRSTAVSVLVPETALIPTAEGEMIAIDRGSSIVVAYGHGLGFATEPDVFACLVEGLCAEHNIKRLELYSDRADALLTKVLNVDVSRMPAVTDNAYYDLLISGADDPPLNLLQGRYGASMSWGTALRRWAPTFYAAAAICAGFVILTVSEGMSLSRQAEQLERETTAIVRSALPDVGRIVNPRVQIQNRVRSLQSGNGDVYLAISAALFESLSQSPSARMEALQFEASRLSLTATLSLSNYEEIETLREAVTSKGYSFEEGNSRSDGRRILSEIKVGVP